MGYNTLEELKYTHNKSAKVGVTYTFRFVDYAEAQRAQDFLRKQGENPVFVLGRPVSSKRKKIVTISWTHRGNQT